MQPRRAYARPDLIAIVSVAAVAACLVIPDLSRSRQAACQLTDADHLRLIIQGMGVFALANDDAYPLPGAIDTGNATVAAVAEAKNTTGHLLSFLIYEGHIKPETCVSPAEANTAQVTVCTTYEYENPGFAADPAHALWDPGFSGTPVDQGQRHTPLASNQSYAPLVYFGAKRTERWSNRGDSPTALFANRGPSYQGVEHPDNGVWELAQNAVGIGSWTLLFYGEPNAWAGHAAYDDGAVLFHETPNPDRTTYTRPETADPRVVADNLFVNEADDASGSGSSAELSTSLNLLMRPIARIQVFGPSTSITIWND